MALEYCEFGDLYSLIEKEHGLSESFSRILFLQIVDAVSFCHASGIVHRDIKPENILIKGKDMVKLSDFGFARKWTVGEKLSTFCGSPGYAPPEILAQKPYSGPEVDLWALGVTLYCMACGYSPFDDPNVSKVYSKVIRCKFEFPGSVSTTFRDLIANVLKIDPVQRLGLCDMQSHPWTLERDGPVIYPKSYAEDTDRHSKEQPTASYITINNSSFEHPKPRLVPTSEDLGPKTNNNGESSITPKTDVQVNAV